MAGVEPATSSLPRMRSTTELHQQHELLFATARKIRAYKNRAENGAQTRDPQLGRLVLYRLSYFRELTTTSATVTFFCGSRWIRTTEGENQQIYSLPHLAALEYSQFYYFKVQLFLSLLSDSNQRPRDYKSRALANWAKEAGLCTFCHALKNTSAEKRCKGSAFFWHDQMFLKKNDIFLHFFAKRGAKSPLSC